MGGSAAGRADGDRSLRDYSLEEYLAAVAARQPAPSGGAVAAVTVASAAGLVGMAARFAADLPGAAELATEADGLRAAVLELGDADAAAYAEVLAAYRAPREQPARRDRIRAALVEAADVPLRIAEVGVRVAAAGLGLARDGNPNLAGDAMTAVLLAEGATRAAAELVRINVELGELDPALADRARSLIARAAEASGALIADKAIPDPEM
ncbi:MAG TPA: cyclodeaminase/cyclohydrolase family protein [Pseudonocardia sp.]|jgi:formiminotetrahydrofolate cyclodeaminase|nr:cyclodeaminase/cyclohydrolase family protein [Pseudonocardia sp.]